jgi:hypothetical protein
VSINQVRTRGVDRGRQDTVLLIRLHRELLRDKQIRPMSDWWSSGRRFKFSQQDQQGHLTWLFRFRPTPHMFD